MDHGNLKAKPEAFGWRAVECDGNDMAALLDALDECPTGADTQTGAPPFIIANTVKGKGVDFMEGNQPWHGGAISHEAARDALRCIDGRK